MLQIVRTAKLRYRLSQHCILLFIRACQRLVRSLLSGLWNSLQHTVGLSEGAGATANPPTKERMLPVSIHKATVNDVGALARVHLTAFKDNKFLRLMYDNASHWEAVIEMLEGRCLSPEYEIRLATTPKLDRIAGWICCSEVRNPELPLQDHLAYHEWTTASAFIVEKAQVRLTKSSGVLESSDQQIRRRLLWDAISQDSMNALWLSMGKARYLIINHVVIDPTFKEAGVESELLSWATAYADREQISTWIQVPGYSCSIFERAGFQEVAHTVLKLEELCNETSDDESDVDISGDYEIKFMVRRAKTRPSP